MRKYKHYIGFDISKHKVDAAVYRKSEFLFFQIIKNEPGDIFEFVRSLKKMSGLTIKNTIFCMEQTGVYSGHLLSILAKAKSNIVVENAYHIKQSFGLVREKTDETDAHRIARYAYHHEEVLRFWQPKRAILKHLAYLSKLRSSILVIRNALKTTNAEQKIFFDKDLRALQHTFTKHSIAALDHDILRIEEEIEKMIQSDDRIKRQMHIITSIPNVGKITALQMIISSNEFKDINDPKKFACYAGIAPFRHESGNMILRKKISHLGNKTIKSLLNLCAFGASRHDAEMRDYYIRKTVTEKKPKMLVMNAIRNKIVHRIFTCIREDRLYVISEQYKKAAATKLGVGS